MRRLRDVIGVMVLFLPLCACATGERIKVGWASADISPDFKVDLFGQLHLRPCDTNLHHDPVTATVLAMESGPGKEQAVLVSLDLLWVHDMADRLRKRVAKRVPDLKPESIVMFATHTHTAPYTSDSGVYPYLPSSRQGDHYREFMLDRVADAVVEAWQKRAYGAISPAQGKAEVGFCRIAVYKNGRANMYGNTAQGDFVEMEGPLDHGVELLYLWDGKLNLTGVVINVACPSQLVEGKSELSADYWHEVRRQLREDPDLPDDLFVLPMCGAAGDQSPRNLQDRSLGNDLKHDWPGLAMNGKRIADAVRAARPAAEDGVRSRLVFRHLSERITLPKKPELGGTFEMELHVFRVGDVSIVTNPFELYTQYGLDLKAQSPARQTFIAQLAGMPAHGGYLPTEKALPGRAYGAQTQNGLVGPEGGKQLVERTLDLLNRLWPVPK